MSNDSFTERSSQSWLGRLGGAIAGIIIGAILFIAAFPLLIWNEGQAINRAKTLEMGSKDVMSVQAAPVDPANDGKLVHVTGDTAAEEPVSDTLFGVSASAIKLRRNVEMFQWVEEKKSETKKNLGGSEETVTTYNYKKEWSSQLIDSGEFQHPEGHGNPSQMTVKAKTVVAEDVTVGDFVLSDALLNMIDSYEPLPVTKMPANLEESSEPVRLYNEGFYVGEDPKQPVVGDARVTFEVVDPGPVSIIAQQTGKTFEPYQVKDLGSIELLQDGTVSANGMFANEMQANNIMAWLIRLAGFVMMFFGLVLIGQPLAVLGDVVPFIGSIVGAGVSLLALVVALPLTLCTIAVAWLAYRPLIGAPIFLVAVACVIFGIRALLRRRKLKAA